MGAAQLKLMAELLNEAATVIHTLMEEQPDHAEKHQVRHFLPDELEGSALMLLDEAAKQP